MFLCLEIKQFLNFSRWSGERNRRNMSSTYILYYAGLNSSGHSLSQICPLKYKNSFSKVRPRGHLIATPSIYFYVFPSKLKKLFCRAALESFAKVMLLILLTLASLLNKESQHTLLVSSNGMLVKRDFISRLTMKSLGCWSAISLR